MARAAARRGLGRHAAFVAVLAALLVGAWSLSGAPFFWPVWPIALLIFTLVRHLRRVRRAAQ